MKILIPYKKYQVCSNALKQVISVRLAVQTSLIMSCDSAIFEPANTKLRIVSCPDPALHKEMGMSAFLVVPSLNSGQTNEVMQCQTCIDISQ